MALVGPLLWPSIEKVNPMILSKKQWVALVCMAILFIFLGGLREILFVNINEQILFDQGGVSDYRVLPYLQFLGDYSLEELNRWKWILTLLFSLCYLLLSLTSLKQILGFHETRRWLLAAYGIGLLISGLSYLSGKLTGQLELGYILSRVIMGALQSPFPLMLMIPALLLRQTE